MCCSTRWRRPSSPTAAGWRASSGGWSRWKGNVVHKDEVEAADAAVIDALGPVRADLLRWRRREVIWRIFAAVAFCLLLVNACEGARSRGRIVDCTTAGPRTPTREDPSTGHRCYDEGARRTAEAVGKIVDADRNGVPDIEELRRDLGLQPAKPAPPP